MAEIFRTRRTVFVTSQGRLEEGDSSVNKGERVFPRRETSAAPRR